MTSLKLGLRHEQTITVDESLTVPRVSQRYAGFADMPPVFATAFLVGFVEWTCIEALRPYLTHEQRTVGVHVDLSHSAATPVGMKVTAAVELIAVDDRRLRFKVACRDEAEAICAGHHDRFIVDAARFLARMERKRRPSRQQLRRRFPPTVTRCATAYRPRRRRPRARGPPRAGPAPPPASHCRA